MENNQSVPESQDYATPGLGLSAEKQVPLTTTEVDKDQLVHETQATDTETDVEPTADLDDVVHEQPPVPPAADAEQDIDDLIHPRA